MLNNFILLKKLLEGMGIFQRKEMASVAALLL